MPPITRDTTLAELAATVSEALEVAALYRETGRRVP